MAPQTILVVGATGQQGGAVIKALLALPEAATRFHILALTRDAQSARAKALAEANKGVVELVQGDSSNPGPIFASQAKGSVSSLFVVTAMGKISEEQQGIPLIDAAVEHGVQHIVFSSVERGGDEKSWSNPTTIKHFASKHHIEIHLRDKAAAEPGKFTWTILRPVAFLDNLQPGFFGGVFTSMWASALSPATKLQFVAVRDIGAFAALALSDPAAWSGRAVGLAGDELTLGEARETFARVTGKKLPQSWALLGKTVMWGVKEVGDMFDFFEKVGYQVEIGERRKEVPMRDFETWLREDSKWMKQ